MGKKAQKRRKRIIPMVVIPEPEPNTRSVLIKSDDGTLFIKGDQSPQTVLVCGKCRSPLTEGISVDQVQNIVLQCNHCKAYNEALAF